MIDHLLTQEVNIVGKGVYKSSLQQRGASSEIGSKGDFSVSDYLIILPPYTPIAESDRVQFQGEEYEVVGTWRVPNELTRTQSHVEASLKVSGSSDPVTGDRPGEEEF